MSPSPSSTWPERRHELQDAPELQGAFPCPGGRRRQSWPDPECVLRLSSRADSHGNRASSLRARDPHPHPDPHRGCDSGAFTYGHRDTESPTNGLGHPNAHPL